MRNRSDPGLFLRLLQQARPQWWWLIATLACSVSAAPLALLLPVPVKVVVDSAIGSQPLMAPLRFLAAGHEPHSSAMLIAVGLLLLTTLLVYLQGLLMWILGSYTGEKLLLDFRSLLFRHVQRLSLAYHDRSGTSDATYRIQHDAPAIQYILGSGIAPLLSAVLTLGGMIYVIFMVDRELALIALTACPSLFLLTYHFGRKINVQWREFKKFDSSVMSIVQEALSGMRVVKAFNREEREHQRFIRESDKRLRRQVWLSGAQGVFQLLVGLVLASGTAAVLYIGVGHVQAGKMTLGSLLLVMGYVAQLYQPLQTLTTKVTEVQSSLVSAERAFALLDELAEVEERLDARPLSRASGSITFRQVSFGYEKERAILRDLSLDILPGARVGVAGQTGAGKSTLLNLLMRFYDPTGGQILLDGVDLREYKLADLRNQFALVLQDPMLFSASIAENIAYARPEASYDEIVAAAKAANVHEFIAGLPEGYQTLVGERGMLLSGGERQRISLARAFLKDAPILLLDEPTSSVDIKTEAGIMQTMEQLMRGRTVLMIAHRLGTLDDCDLRIEIKEGRLVSALPSDEVTYSVTEGEGSIH